MNGEEQWSGLVIYIPVPAAALPQGLAGGFRLGLAEACRQDQVEECPRGQAGASQLDLGVAFRLGQAADSQPDLEVAFRLAQTEVFQRAQVADFLQVPRVG